MGLPHRQTGFLSTWPTPSFVLRLQSEGERCLYSSKEWGWRGGIGASLGKSLSPFAYFYLPSTTSDDGADPDVEKSTTDSLELKHQSYVHRFLPSTLTH